MLASGKLVLLKKYAYTDNAVSVLHFTEDKYLLISLERFSTTTPTFWWQKRPILSTESTPTGHINSGRARAQRDDGIHPAPGSALENSGASGSRRHQLQVQPVEADPEEGEGGDKEVIRQAAT